jgi:hypothetical protein
VYLKGEFWALSFLAYVSGIWRNIQSNIRLYADDYTLYGKILDVKDIEKLQTHLDRSGSGFPSDATLV